VPDDALVFHEGKKLGWAGVVFFAQKCVPRIFLPEIDNRCVKTNTGEKKRGEGNTVSPCGLHFTLGAHTRSACTKKNPMQIFVKTLTGRKASFELEPEQTVRCGAGVLWCSWREKPGAPQ
jgi:hypothetical protein